ncbi:pyridoxal phosphate-dependent decarboxylase family protein [Nonomuraea helvata]|uniref:Pyridoxal phosphate-dependent decarboxylase family protein n=1 Tax=Nonomuraea helvata TaxID=37484 RepID=A0ABV5RTK8_9ACTN
MTTNAISLGTPEPEPRGTTHDFPLSSPGSDDLHTLIGTVLQALSDGAQQRGGPVPAGEPVELAGDVRDALGPLLLREGRGVGVLASLTEILARGAVDLADPAWSAHLLSPPLAISAAADVAAAILNADLTSWDQSPAGIIIESEVVRAMCTLVGYDPDAAAGVVTSGGTESNLVGLFLARDRPGGPGPAHGRSVVYASRSAHFSIRRSARLLGFPDENVIPVETNARDQMDPDALRAALEGGTREGRWPACVVATTGTTDFGAIDPVEDIITISRAHGAAVHVDAAYGGGALFSGKLASLLTGIDGADSVSLDLHKFGWQPIGAGVLLTRRADAFAPMAFEAPYVNAADDLRAGHLNHTDRSLRTTRRADAFKIAVTLQAVGTERLGEMVDHCHMLARHAARRIALTPYLALACDPVLSTVVFRYVPRADVPARSDAVNVSLRRRILAEGKAVVGRTELRTRKPSVWLKLTLLNPFMTVEDVDWVLDVITSAGSLEDGGDTS